MDEATTAPLEPAAPEEPLPTGDPLSPAETGSRARAFDESLVLCAEAIPHRVDSHEQGWAVFVDPLDAPRAQSALEAWEQENRTPVETPKRRWEGQTPAPIFAAICIAGELALGPRDDQLLWFQRGTADASAILHGEVWRCATALTLHADLAHAAGNAVFGYVIIDALSRKLGPAWAAWLTLLAGIAGNWLTAWAVRTNHFSIGASTAVFGALGALVACQLLSRERSAFITLGAGVALFALLGTSARADLFAHFFGALAGFFLGLGATALQREAPEERTLQPLLAIAALLPLAAAWWRALL